VPSAKEPLYYQRFYTALENAMNSELDRRAALGAKSYSVNFSEIGVT